MDMVARVIFGVLLLLAIAAALTTRHSCVLEDVVRDVYIPWNPDSQEITVTTNSTAGSYEKVDVYFYDDNDEWAGGLYIPFYSPIRYGIGCNTYYTYLPFPVTLPTDTDKTWRISYNHAEKRLLLHCNGEEVMNLVLSESVCGDGDWRSAWGEYPTKIKFSSSSDTASQQYCLEDGSSLPETCGDISSNIPGGSVIYSPDQITEGTTATVSCDPALEVTGEDSLTCVGGRWDADLPTCTPRTGTCTYNGEGGTTSTHSPDKASFSAGEEIQVTCIADDTTTQHTCTDGTFTPAITHCLCVLEDVVRNVLIPWDPESEHIIVTTNSAVGSYEQVQVYFYDDNGDDAGGLVIYFYSQIEYWIVLCSSSWTTSPVTLPTDTDKTWRLSYNPAEKRVLLHCNGEEVVNLVISDSVCDDDSWRSYWERYPTKIKFRSWDTASQQYCLAGKPPVVECSGLDSSWDNLKTTTEFSVDWGTTVTVSCDPGYELSGDNQITCDRDTSFTYDTEPTCQQLANKVMCSGTTETSEVYGNGTYQWPPIDGGTIKYLPCHYNENEMASKECSYELGRYLITDFSKCKSAVAEEMKKILEETKNVSRTNEKAITNDLEELSREKGSQMNSDDVEDTAYIITKVLSLQDQVSNDSLENMMTTVDNIHVQTEPEQFEDDDVTGSKLRKSAVDIVATVAARQPTGILETRQSVGFGVASSDQGSSTSTLALSGDKINDLEGSTNENNQENTYFSAEVTPPEGGVAIAVYYENDKTFKSPSVVSPESPEPEFLAIELGKVLESTTKKKNAIAFYVASIISDINIFREITPGEREILQPDNIILNYKVSNEPKHKVLDVVSRKSEVTSEPTCKFYNESLLDWSDEGCSTNKTYNEFTNQYNVICSCDHLTSFAVLMAVTSDMGSGVYKAEDITTQVLQYLSIICLVLTLLAILLNKKLRKMKSFKINLMLTISLLISTILFRIMEMFVGTSTTPSAGCIAIAFMLHYFWLTQLCWMVIEAVTLYLALVEVFGTYISRAMLKYSLVGWGAPILFPAIGLGLGGVGEDGYADPRTCFISKSYRLLFYIPIVIGILANAVLFYFLVRVIIKANREKAERVVVSGLALKRKQFQSALSVFILLGLGWAFGFILIGDSKHLSLIQAPFRWLFILTNAPQGCLIFVFYVILNGDLVKFWRRKFKICLGGTKSKTSSATSSAAPKYHGNKKDSGNTSSTPNPSTQITTLSSSQNAPMDPSTAPPNLYQDLDTVKLDRIKDSPDVESGVDQAEDIIEQDDQEQRSAPPFMRLRHIFGSHRRDRSRINVFQLLIQELIIEWDNRGIDHVYSLDRPVTSSEAPEGPPTREIVAQGSLESDQTTGSATEEHEGGASKWDKTTLFTDKDERALQKLEERKGGDGKVKLYRIKESPDVEPGVDQAEDIVEIESSEAPEGPPTREVVAQGSLESDQATSSATEEHEGGSSKWDKIAHTVLANKRALQKLEQRKGRDGKVGFKFK